METNQLDQKFKKIETDIALVEKQLTDDNTGLQNITRTLRMHENDMLSEFENELLQVAKAYAMRMTKFFGELENMKHELSKLSVNFESGTGLLNKFNTHHLKKIETLTAQIEDLENKVEDCDKHVTEINQKLGLEVDEKAKLRDEILGVIDAKVGKVTQELEDYKLGQKMKLGKEMFLETKDYIEQLVYDILRKREQYYEDKETQYRTFLAKEINDELNRMRAETGETIKSISAVLDDMHKENVQRLNVHGEDLVKKLETLKRMCEDSCRKLQNEFDSIVQTNKLVKIINQ